MAIVGKIKSIKAPGIDGIPTRALKETMNLKPNVFAKMYNACLKERIFNENFSDWPAEYQKDNSAL